MSSWDTVLNSLEKARVEWDLIVKKYQKLKKERQIDRVRKNKDKNGQEFSEGIVEK